MGIIARLTGGDDYPSYQRSAEVILQRLAEDAERRRRIAVDVADVVAVADGFMPEQGFGNLYQAVEVQAVEVQAKSR